MEKFVGAPIALGVAALASLLLIAKDWLRGSRQIKVLEAGTFLLFAGLCVYAVLCARHWSVMEVRLLVDIGLLTIVLVSMLIGQPFTLQYAREQVPREVWVKPAFVRGNYIISAAWAVALVVLVAADLLLVLVPTAPTWIAIAATLAAIGAAAKFTLWYPAQANKQHAADKAASAKA